MYGLKVRQRREALGIRQHEFSVMIDTTQAYLSLIESCDRLPSATVHMKIVKALNDDSSVDQQFKKEVDARVLRRKNRGIVTLESDGLHVEYKGHSIVLRRIMSGDGIAMIDSINEFIDKVQSVTGEQKTNVETKE